MSLSFVLYTDPILHKPCTPVAEINNDLLELAGSMIVEMHANRGVGLAANQVGIDKRFAVVSLENGTKDFAIINPEIIDKSKEKEVYSEGCLSCPGVSIPMKRPTRVVVRCYDLHSNEVTYEFTGLDARILQHEIDHLNGRMIITDLHK